MPNLKYPIYLIFISFLVTLTQSCNTVKHETEDWLIDGKLRKSEVRITDNQEIQISNGLIQRTFFIGTNLACTDFTNLMTETQMLRTVMPEASITLNGKTYNVGGLYGQKERAYFKKEWLKDMQGSSDDFQYQSMVQSEITFHFPTNTNFWTSHKKDASGKKVTFNYAHPAFRGLTLSIHYEIFDNLPLIGKYLTLENNGASPVEINQVVNEILAVVEEESAVVGSTDKMKKPHHLYVENNFAFNNAMHAELSSQATHWKADPFYTSQVNYDLLTPSIMKVYPDEGVGIKLNPGENFKSIRTYELVLDSYDRERNGLARRKMYRALAPWVLQNPIFMHVVSKTDEEVINAIDQCVATGYEALILSFGSHINMEDTSEENIKRWKALADYAHEKGVKIGGYSLFSSRTISPEHDVISRLTGKPGGAFFGNAPCLASQWGLDYLDKLKYFFEKTGFDIFENDGPYPGDVCASTSHPGHEGLHDSQWVQFQLQKELYQWMNARGIYINAPDWYFLDGTHKIALGYREVNFSLPREQQKILNRQNIFDGTWEKTPSMGWGFVPLTAYHGGGKDAVLEPLSEHLEDYKQLMMQYYGAGVQACYRGPRLYDTEETKEMVVSVIEWYKKYRDILNADIIRLRRADGRDWDGWMHVDPKGKEKALVMLFNPTDRKLEKNLTIPLYYTGLHTKAEVSVEGKGFKNYPLNKKSELSIEVNIPPDGYTWLVIE
ncbi:alpha-galactosidase [Cyclobacteriaceae bacterium YHN15]|nr:alpha-galactosidase [Cyclobacteriaceae bacterium YHN15]